LQIRDRSPRSHPVQKQGRPVPLFNGILGSARVSRAGDGVLAIANFCFDWFFTAEITEITKPEQEC